MTTPTGQIGLYDVNVELSKSGTAQIGMNDTDVRTLAGVASGQIAMSDLQGKSAYVPMAPYITGAGTYRSVGSTDASANLTVYPNGGVGPYTFSWYWYSGATLYQVPHTITSPNKTLSNQTSGTLKTANYQCVIQDSTGAQATAYTGTMNLYKYAVVHENMANTSVTTTSPTAATAQMSFYADGTSSAGANWVSPAHSGVGIYFQIAFSASSGTISASSSGVMSTGRYVNVTRSTVGTSTTTVLSTITLNPAQMSGNFSWAQYHTLTAKVNSSTPPPPPVPLPPPWSPPLQIN